MFKGAFSYIEKDTWLHRSAPEFKLIVTLLTFIITIILHSLIHLLLINIFLLLLFISIKPHKQLIRSYLLMLITLIVSTALSQGLFYYKYYQGEETAIILVILPGDIFLVSLLTFGKGIVLSYDGLMYGLIVGLKIIAAIQLSMLLITTTKLSEIINTLRKIRIPTKLITAIIMGIKFVPVILEELQKTILAVKQKGYQISSMHIPFLIKVITSNLIFNNVRRALALAVSLELRGFNGNILFKKSQSDKLSNFLLLLCFVVILLFSFM